MLLECGNRAVRDGVLFCCVCAGINVTTALSNPQKEFVKVSIYMQVSVTHGFHSNGVILLLPLPL